MEGAELGQPAFKISGSFGDIHTRPGKRSLIRNDGIPSAMRARLTNPIPIGLPRGSSPHDQFSHEYAETGLDQSQGWRGVAERTVEASTGAAVVAASSSERGGLWAGAFR
jgi:hypothetical protein